MQKISNAERVDRSGLAGARVLLFPPKFRIPPLHLVSGLTFLNLCPHLFDSYSILVFNFQYGARARKGPRLRLLQCGNHGKVNDIPSIPLVLGPLY